MKTQRPTTAFRHGLALASLTILMATTSQAAGIADEILTIEPPKVVVAPGGTASFSLPVTIKPQHHAMANKVAEGYVPTVLSLGQRAAEGFRLDVTYPPGKPLVLFEGLEPINVYEGTVRLQCRLTVPADAALAETTLPLDLHYQACSESTCLPPKHLAIPLPLAIVSASQAPPSDNGAASQPPVAESDAGDWLGRLEGAGLVGLLALVFVMGLAMNLTPCVFPVVPVTVGFFASQGKRSVGATVLLAAVYVLGMAVVFTILGSAAALAGSQIGWALQSPWGVAVLCVVLAVLAASLFGAFEIRLPSSLLGSLQGKSGLFGALVMGAAVGLVAAPCVGPFVAALVIYVGELGSRMAAQGAGRLAQAAAGGGLFFVFSLGLGLPYLLLGAFTSLLTRVPRGGPWLVWVRSLLAFPVLGLILYFLRPYLSEPQFWLPTSALPLVAALYLGFIQGRTFRPWSRGFRIARTVTAAALVVAGVVMLATEALPSLELRETIPWAAYQDGDLETARNDGRPAVLYVTAAWCANCRVMDRKVFRDDEVHLAAEGVRLLKIDVTAGPPTQGTRAAALYAEFVHGGPPVLVFYDRRGKVTAQRSDLDKDEFLQLLQQINGLGN
ncbi:MAG: thioredoxin family protein [Planctomycetes bacterium]|nr:thioredoxin family protein [Planctomycetota bacterium]